MLYMVSGSLMSNSQLSVQPPQVIPSSLHFGNYADAFSGMTQVIQLRSFLNSVIFTVGVVSLQWLLCISGGLVIAKMQFRARKVIIALFGVSLFIPNINHTDPYFHRHVRTEDGQHLSRVDPPHCRPDRFWYTAVPPVHKPAARGTV